MPIPPSVKKPSVKKWSAVILSVVVLAFCVVAVRDSWAAVRSSISRLSVAEVIAAGFVTVLSLVAAFRSWIVVLRSMLGRDVPHGDARTIYFVSQLAKYVPGSVWPAVIQAQFGTRNGIPRSTMVTSYAVALLTTLTASGLLSGLVFAGHDVKTSVLLLAAGALAGGVVGAVVLVHRAGLARLLQWVAARRRAKAETLVAASLPPAALCWAAAFWLLQCTQAVIVARALAPDALEVRDMLLVAGAFALSWLCGFLVIPVPAGAGIREAVLVLALVAVMDRPSAIAVALITRLVLVITELALAGVVSLPHLVRSGRSRRTKGTNGPVGAAGTQYSEAE